MTIVQKIINSIKEAHGDDFPVYYHDEPTLNLMTSQMQFPCALLQLLTTGRAIQEGGMVKERVSAAVFFVEPSQFDFDAEENETIIDRCKKKAFAWISYLPYSPDVELVDVTRTSRVYDRYDDILTGFGILAEIKEAVGWSQCESQVCPTDFNSDFNDDFGGRCYNPIYNN